MLPALFHLSVVSYYFIFCLATSPFQRLFLKLDYDPLWALRRNDALTIASNAL